MQIISDEKSLVQVAEMLPGCFETYTSGAAVPSLVLLFQNGISIPFMGFRMPAQSPDFLAKKKNLCLLVSEERPENNGLDITDFTVYFWLSLILPAGQHFPLPPVSPCVSNLLPSSGWGWCSGTAGEGIGVDRLCTQRNPSGWQRGCNQRKPSSDAWTTPPSCFK